MKINKTTIKVLIESYVMQRIEFETYHFDEDDWNVVMYNDSTLEIEYEDYTFETKINENTTTLEIDDFVEESILKIKDDE